MTTTVTLDELPGLIGKPLGQTDYREVTQEQVNQFAEATDDHQWIHTDPERARSGPFGGPIAHGYLSLSLLIPLWAELLDVTDVGTKINYGLDKVRFPAPVPVGAKVRMGATITAVTEVPGGVQLTFDAVIEMEGQAKPAVAATAIHRFLR